MQILIWGDNMNRKVSICILAFILIVLIVVLVVMAGNKKETPVVPTETQELVDTEPAVIANTDHVTQYRYIARIVDERLVIFESDNHTVYFETGIRANVLSAHVREQARTGIGFQSEASMYDFLESYSS